MKKWQFTKDEVVPLFAAYGDLINKGTIQQISPCFANRVKGGRTVSGHSTDTRVLQYHLWVSGQVFDKKYFKYEVQHDPVQRYTGTAKTNWAIQFWMNKIRGVYYERDAVVSRVRREISALDVKGFTFEENKQALSLIHRFTATTLPEVSTELEGYLFPLINAVHPTFCSIVDVFGIVLTDEERRKVIEGTVLPAGLNRISESFGSDPKFNRNVPKHLRLSVFERDRYSCKYCGVSADPSQLHADHIFPVSLGGLTVTENLQTLCAPCNLRKGGRP